jgi:hypothetical protein
LLASSDIGVTLFTYNRPLHTAEVLRGLARTGVDHLYIFQDGLRPGHSDADHRAVTELVEKIDFCKVTFHKSDANRGLATALTGGIAQVLSQRPAIIVLEDDCRPSPAFFDYMRFCLDHFRANPRVFSISGYGLPSLPKNYPYDVCFSPLSSSWGWATWADRWQKFDPAAAGWQDLERDSRLRARFNRPGSLFYPMLQQQMRGQVNSWAIRWYYTHFKHDAVCVWPIRSFIQNIGMDGTGVHCIRSDDFDTEVAETFSPEQFRAPPSLDLEPSIGRAFRRHYDTYSPWRLWKLLKHRENWPELAKRFTRYVPFRRSSHA